MLIIFFWNWIEGLMESIYGPALFVQLPGEAKYIKVSSTYLSHTVSLNGAIPKAIYSKYSRYMFAITGDNDEPMAKPSFY